MHNTILSMQDISKKYIQDNKEVIVLNAINTTFAQKKSYAITGKSGAGKSTLMHVLAGINKPSSGTVLCNNISIYDLPDSDHAQFLNKSIGLVFQSSYLLRELSVVENVLLPGLIGGYHKQDCYKRAHFLLKTVELFHKKENKIGELSGGQQQRVAIARALFNEPLFLIADEPTSNLDTATSKAIIDLLLSCQQEWGMGIIISSHDAYIAEKMDIVYTLHEGKLV